MLVIVPTYKRLDSLYWVLYSLMNCDLPFLECKPKVAIINNYPPNEYLIDVISKKINREHRNSSNWEWIFLNRTETLPPVKNWYDAVFQLSQDNEIVFIVGDDDPLPKSSLIRRYNELSRTNALFIFGKLHSMYFTINPEKILLLEAPMPSYNPSITQVDFNNILMCTPIHISNHCFKFDKRFISSYNIAMDWCNKSIGFNFNDRTLFIPLFIPLASLILKYPIIFIDDIVVFRGMNIKEISSSVNGIANWDLGYISLIAYDIIMKNPDLNKIPYLDSLKADMVNTYKNSYYSTLLNKEINRKALKKIEQEIGLNNMKLSFKNHLHNIYSTSKNVLHLNGITLRKKALNRSINAIDFFKKDN